MTGDGRFTVDEARRIGEEIGIEWASSPFDVEQFRMGMDVELEHGLQDLLTNVTGDEPTVTGKIGLAHLKESLTTTRASRGWRQRRGGITRVEASRSRT